MLFSLIQVNEQTKLAHVSYLILIQTSIFNELTYSQLRIIWNLDLNHKVELRWASHTFL